MTVVVVIICILSIILVGIVLIQKSKGGGLAAGFQSSNQIMGAPKTTDFLEKATWTLMGVIAVLCIICTLTINYASSDDQSNQIELRQNNSLPAMPEGVSEPSAPAADVPVAPEAE